MHKMHHYEIDLVWTGNVGEGTKTYRSYQRNHDISAKGKPVIPGSSDPVFRGDASRYNPEDMLVASLSACHLLTYLHLCADHGVVVEKYIDNASGTMEEVGRGGHFTEVILRPLVTVADSSMIEKANELHHEASKFCFVASSVNFPVRHEPRCEAIR
ncbi:MAG: OsmC family protein [Chitinophagales bacterium]